jgi:hypothetical protein
VLHELFRGNHVKNQSTIKAIYVRKIFQSSQFSAEGQNPLSSTSFKQIQMLYRITGYNTKKFLHKRKNFVK